ncbi:hypothetical protein E5288_WYG020798 [Bos mutus]|uniref:Uncharacterized protein n=1 Tax=Bos mutus TaxID=72004 RepID=A0A6B0R300_9CETA|nr:hypothetical protein [Bos mutus]
MPHPYGIHHRPTPTVGHPLCLPNPNPDRDETGSNASPSRVTGETAPGQVAILDEEGMWEQRTCPGGSQTPRSKPYRTAVCRPWAGDLERLK